MSDATVRCNAQFPSLSALQDHALSTGHSRALWGVTTVVVIGYSYLLSTMLPFFSELVCTYVYVHDEL